jgi:hypothetical protein
MTGPAMVTRRDVEELAGALCAETEPDLFFPNATQRLQAATAAKVCETCPVRKTCREQAEARGEKFGVWGGKNFDPQASTTLHPFRCGTYSGYGRHRKLGEAPCEPCNDARLAHEREHRARKKAALTQPREVTA